MPDPARNESNDCGTSPTLGSSNDEPEAIQIEIEAARRAAEYRDYDYRPGYDRFDYCPTTRSEELCGLCEAFYLASQIATHNEVDAARTVLTDGPMSRCLGWYDDGIADGNLTACSRQGGCGLSGCAWR